MPAVRQQFLIAYYRNGFANLVSLPLLADVKRLGTNGRVQEFPDAAKTGRAGHGHSRRSIGPDSLFRAGAALPGVVSN